MKINESNTENGRLVEILPEEGKVLVYEGIESESLYLAKSAKTEDVDERDALGKVIQTLEGTGTAENPYKGWDVGQPVESGKWYLTPGGYLWEAIADGFPLSDCDTAFFDVVGL